MPTKYKFNRGNITKYLVSVSNPRDPAILTSAVVRVYDKVKNIATNPKIELLDLIEKCLRNER